MKLTERLAHELRNDRQLQMVLRNTCYLFSSNTISMGLSSLGGILAALMLGPAEYGVLGMVILYTSSVNRLLSFRMGELVVKYAGGYLATGQKSEAAAVVKLAGLLEAVTSVLAYLLLVLSAPLATRYIIKDPAATGWIVFFGVSLLAYLMNETSTALLQVGNHFRSQAVFNLLQNILTFAWIVFAYFTHGGIVQVINAYLAGKLVLGLGVLLVALRWSTPMLGPGWWRARLNLLPDLPGLIRFAISTNLSSTINMVIRDSEVLWVGFFCNPTQAGWFKFSVGLINIVRMPVMPFITTTFPEISRLVAQKEWSRLRLLLRRTSGIAAAWMGACAVGFALLGYPALAWLKQGVYLPSYASTLILLVGYAVADIFFWNRPLLLAFNRPNDPLVITALVGALKIALMFVLVRPFGYLAQAALLSGYFVISVLWIVRRGRQELQRSQEAEA